MYYAHLERINMIVATMPDGTIIDLIASLLTELANVTGRANDSQGWETLITGRDVVEELCHLIHNARGGDDTSSYRYSGAKIVEPPQRVRVRELADPQGGDEAIQTFGLLPKGVVMAACQTCGITRLLPEHQAIAGQAQMRCTAITGMQVAIGSRKGTPIRCGGFMLEITPEWQPAEDGDDL